MLQNVGEETSWKADAWKKNEINMDVTKAVCEDGR
jgi:hypothetical protein